MTAAASASGIVSARSLLTPQPRSEGPEPLPKKLKGIATATAIAWAERSPISVPATSASRTTRSISSEATLTAKKRMAWKEARFSPGPKVQ